MASMLSRLNPLDLYLWGHLKTLLCAAPVDMEEALLHRIVDACQTIRIYPSNFEQMQQSRHALNLMKDSLSNYYKCALSAITRTLYVSAHMLIRTFFFFLFRCVELVPKVCLHLSVAPCIFLQNSL